MTSPMLRGALLALVLLAAAAGIGAAEPPRLPSEGSHFLALLLPAPHRPSVERFLEPLRKDFPDLGWTPAVKLHLTLAYVGSLDRTTRSRLVTALEEETSALPPFELGYEGLGTFDFSRTATPRVLWGQPVGDSEALGGLAAACRRAVHRATGRDDSLAFVPHMTLGRAEDPGLGRRLATARATAGLLRTPLDTVSEAVLLRGGSPLDRGRYTVLARFHLRPPGGPRP